MITYLLSILLSHNVYCDNIFNKRFAFFDITMDQPISEDYGASFLVTYNIAAGQTTQGYYFVVPAGTETHRVLLSRVPSDYNVASYTLTGWGPAGDIITTESNVHSSSFR